MSWKWVAVYVSLGLAAGLLIGGTAVSALTTSKSPAAKPLRPVVPRIASQASLIARMGKPGEAAFPGEKLNAQLAGTTCVDWQSQSRWVVFSCS